MVKVKVKFTLQHAINVQRGVEVYLYSFFNIGFRWGVGGERNVPSALRTGMRPGTHCAGGWVGLRADLDGYRKSRPPPGPDTRTVQPVAGCCTDYAFPVLAFGGTQGVWYSPPQCSCPEICGVKSTDS